jgi:hypothetical protein
LSLFQVSLLSFLQSSVSVLESFFSQQSFLESEQMWNLTLSSVPSLPILTVALKIWGEIYKLYKIFLYLEIAVLISLALVKTLVELLSGLVAQLAT